MCKTPNTGFSSKFISSYVCKPNVHFCILLFVMIIIKLEIDSIARDEEKWIAYCVSTFISHDEVQYRPDNLVFMASVLF